MSFAAPYKIQWRVLRTWCWRIGFQK